MTDDRALLEAYVRDRSEPAFTELVRRHLGLVHGTALRLVGGDPQLAEDVAQIVFTAFARKAPGLLGHRSLAGWFYTGTHHAAANLVRAERRRRRHETAALAMHETEPSSAATDAEWSRVRPVIDESLQQLSASDREALLLRFFSGRGFPEIAATLRVTESGARMRVARALEKLRARLEHRGIRSTTAALGAALTVPGLATAPAGLALAISQSAFTVAAAGSTAGLLGLLCMTKSQIALVAATAVVAAGSITWELNESLDRRPASAVPAAISSPPAVETALAPTPSSDGPGVITRDDSDLPALRRAVAAQQTRLAQLRAAQTRPARPPSAVRTSPRTGAPILDAAAADVWPATASTVAPKFPAALRTARIPGEAIVQVIVDADGTVLSIEPEDATHPDFAIAAIDAVQRWKFKPAQKDGQPVAVRMQLPIRFVFDQPNWF